jgi:SAM-dependent methyltransferase
MKPNIFVCPVCKGTLVHADPGFHCPACAREYPIIDGIPDFFVSAVAGTATAEEDQAWRENLVWLDPQMAAARDTIYRLSVRELKGMNFAMQQVGLRTFPGCRILEVGTGTGHFARWMAEVSAPGTEIYAIDFSGPMFAKAQANIADLPGVILLRANSTGKLPFRAESFDLVFLRLAPLGVHGMPNVQAAFQLLKPGGFLFKAGWSLVREDTPWTEAAIQHGYESAEVHEWQYPRLKTREEYAASQVELERAIAFGAPFRKGPEPAWEGDCTVSITWENLRIARKPDRQRVSG